MAIKHKVLDKGWIELQDIMGNDLAIVNAARTSFLGESKGEDKDKKLLFYLLKHGHTTPFEMVEFKFRIKAPLITCWHWFRHRTQSYSVQSGRYTELKEFYIPEKWRLQSEDNKQASKGVLNSLDSAYLDNAIITHIEQSVSLYKQALEMGVAKELARLFLPAFAAYYTFIAKVNAHNLMHFLKLRMEPEVQHEIRVYADAIYDNFFNRCLPWTAEAFDKYILEEYYE